MGTGLLPLPQPCPLQSVPGQTHLKGEIMLLQPVLLRLLGLDAPLSWVAPVLSQLCSRLPQLTLVRTQLLLLQNKSWTVRSHSPGVTWECLILSSQDLLQQRETEAWSGSSHAREGRAGLGTSAHVLAPSLPLLSSASAPVHAPQQAPEMKPSHLYGHYTLPDVDTPSPRTPLAHMDSHMHTQMQWTKGQLGLGYPWLYDAHTLTSCPDTHDAPRPTRTSMGYTATGRDAHAGHPPQHSQASCVYVCGLSLPICERGGVQQGKGDSIHPFASSPSLGLGMAQELRQGL